MKPAASPAHVAEIRDAGVRADLDERANRFEVVSRLADDLAHEIKNPLNAIVVNLEVLRRKIASGATEQALERTRVLDAEMARVHAIVDQLLQLMRPPKAERNPIPVDEVLEDLRPLLEVQARAARINLDLQLQSDCFVRTRRDLLKFGVLNLIAAVYESSVPLASIAVEARESGADVEIVVRTDPPAFDHDSEFVQYAAEIIEKEGGTVELGEPGNAGTGSRARLRLPTCSSFA